MTNIRIDYYKKLYENNEVTMEPSNFAKDIVPYLSKEHTLYDLGGGNLRDALYLSAFVKKVIVVDPAAPPVPEGYPNVSIRNVPVHDYLSDFSSTEPCVIYCRFLLHLLTKEERLSLYSLLRNFAPADSLLFFEYRLHHNEDFYKKQKDMNRPKRQSVTYKDPFYLSEKSFSVVLYSEVNYFSTTETEDPLLQRVFAIRKCLKSLCRKGAGPGDWVKNMRNKGAKKKYRIMNAI